MRGYTCPNGTSTFDINCRSSAGKYRWPLVSRPTALSTWCGSLLDQSTDRLGFRVHGHSIALSRASSYLLQHPSQRHNRTYSWTAACKKSATHLTGHIASLHIPTKRPSRVYLSYIRPHPHILLPALPQHSVKLDPRDTPPPLHHSPVTSEVERASTAEPTPVGTPRAFHSLQRRNCEKEHPLSSWHRPTHAFAQGSSSYVDSALLEGGLDDSTFPLFGDFMSDNAMGGLANPIDTGSSGSWQNQHSNLTTALQSTSGNEARPSQAMNITGTNGKPGSLGLRHRESLGGVSGSDWKSSSGAQPISMNREKPRRESLAGSMIGGMSWGGVSVGSWVRDDIIMQGSSPFPYRSPSYHSSSYFPKLEANFMKDFRCCDITLPTTHELLHHYEECHAQQMPDTLRKQSIQNNPSPAPPNTADRGQGRSQKEPLQADTSNIPQNRPLSRPSAQLQIPQVAPLKSEVAATEYESAQVVPGQDMDSLQDMEMDMDDDAMAPPENFQPQQYQMPDQSRMMQRSQFGQPQSMRVPPLNIDTLNMVNPLQQHQGLRNSTPSTPIGPGRNAQMYQHNPTVSSVNTPTLSAHPRHQQQYVPTPDSSAPGTPGEPILDYPGGALPIGGHPFMQDQSQFGTYYDFGDGHDMGSLYIDEPAKRLFHNVNKKFTKQPPVSQLGDGQYSENSEVARTIREVQRSVGVPEPQTDGGVPKPFHCPVIGCEKAYKNQNGLKYHKMHGHNSQRLADNKDGTYSIVDPETLCPYPGTMGMEKHKPYRCDVCGKRYKNLNGLKYHKSHSTACDNEPRPDTSFMISPSTMHMPGNPSPFGEDMDL